MSKLDNLRNCSQIVADTGDLDSIKEFKPEDCTTNPSLILKAVESGKYRNLISDVVSVSKNRKFNSDDELIEFICDQLSIAFGIELTKIIPGLVSTEVDANLSFDIQGTVNKAKNIINSYEQSGIDKSRILIKVAGTWEGIKAVGELESYGIRCNCTLIFSLTQAVACADSGAYLISPFVGRITDWFKENSNTQSIEVDPGVQSVSKIYEYFKTFNYNTIIMAASFRNINQITSLAGCDKLTISPKLLSELKSTEGEVPIQLLPENKKYNLNRLNVSESSFRWHLNQNQMASFKLAEGIRLFNRDLEVLKQLIKKEI